MTSLASESERVGTVWNSPSFSCEVASSSFCGSSRLRCVGSGNGVEEVISEVPAITNSLDLLFG